MSKYKNCALFADANTPPRYCCTRKVFTVNSDSCVQVSIIGPTVDLLLFPSGDTDDTSMVAATLEPGTTTITEPGLYMLDLDCDALDGTTAPTDVAEQMLVCCKRVPKAENAGELEALEALCTKLETLIITSNDATALAEIISQLSDLCDKILASTAADAVANAALIASLMALCDKLLAQSEQDAILSAELLACLEDLKELNTCPPVEAATAVTTDPWG